MTDAPDERQGGFADAQRLMSTQALGPAAESRAQAARERAAGLMWEELHNDPPWSWVLSRLGLRQTGYTTWVDRGGNGVYELDGDGFMSMLRVAGAKEPIGDCEQVIVNSLYAQDRELASQALLTNVLGVDNGAQLPPRLRNRIRQRWVADDIAWDALASLVGTAAGDVEDAGSGETGDLAGLVVPPVPARPSGQSGPVVPPVKPAADRERTCLICAGTDQACVVCGTPPWTAQAPWSGELPDRSEPTTGSAVAVLDIVPATPPPRKWPMAGDEHPSLRILSRADLDALPRVDWAVDGLLPQRGLAALVGGYGTGKSLLMLSLVAAMSSGHPWHGRAVQQQPVLMVSLEGFYAIPERVRAYEQVQGEHFTNVHWISEPVDLKRSADVDRLLNAARAVRATVVVVDSARAAGAAAEDTADMGRFVAGLEQVRRELDGLVIVLHNTGWDTTRERGSTVLPDACDVVLLLQERNGRRQLTHRKCRDGAPLEAGQVDLAFEAVDGTDSGVLVAAGAVEARPQQLETELLALVAADPGRSTNHYTDRSSAPRTEVSRTLNRLLREGRLDRGGNGSRAQWRLPAQAQ